MIKKNILYKILRELIKIGKKNELIFSFQIQCLCLRLNLELQILMENAQYLYLTNSLLPPSPGL